MRTVQFVATVPGWAVCGAIIWLIGLVALCYFAREREKEHQSNFLLWIAVGELVTIGPLLTYLWWNGWSGTL